MDANRKKELEESFDRMLLRYRQSKANKNAVKNDTPDADVPPSTEPSLQAAEVRIHVPPRAESDQTTELVEVLSGAENVKREVTSSDLAPTQTQVTVDAEITMTAATNEISPTTVTALGTETDVTYPIYIPAPMPMTAQTVMYDWSSYPVDQRLEALAAQSVGSIFPTTPLNMQDYVSFTVQPRTLYPCNVCSLLIPTETEYTAHQREHRRQLRRHCNCVLRPLRPIHRSYRRRSFGTRARRPQQ